MTFALAAQNRMEPTPSDSLFVAGLAGLRAQKFADAEAAFRKLSELEPAALRGVMGIAQVYMAQGKEDDALRVLGEESAKAPARADLHVAIGDIAARAHRYDVALAEFQQALADLDFKSSATFYLHRGVVSGNALADSIAAIVGPDSTPKGAGGIYLRIGEIAYLKGDRDGTIAALRKARELQPDNAMVLGALALQLEAAGQKPEAMAAYREALAVNPNNPVMLNNLAFLMAEAGADLFEALRFARRALMLQPQMAEISDTVGWISLKQGWTDDAIGIFTEVVRKAPGNAAFRKHLALALEQTGSHSTAIEELKATLNSDPSVESNLKVQKLLEGPIK